MKRFLLVATFIFAFIGATGQNELKRDRTMPVVAYWKINDSANYSINYVFTTNLYELDIKELTHNFTWKVVSESDSHYCINTNINKVQFVHRDTSKNNSNLENINLKYITNETGGDVRLIRLKEYQNLDYPNDKIFEISEIFYERIREMSTFYGLQYKRGTTYTYDTTIMDFTGNIYAAKKKIKLLDRSDSICKLWCSVEQGKKQIKSSKKEFKRKKEEISCTFQAILETKHGYLIAGSGELKYSIKDKYLIIKYNIQRI